MKTIRVIRHRTIDRGAAARGHGAAGLGGLPEHGKLKGTYAFRLGPAKGFDADLANSSSDPGNVGGARRQDVLRVGVFTSDVRRHISYRAHACHD